MVIGMERFKRSRGELDPYLFIEDVFFAPVTRETDVLAPYLYRRLRERYRQGRVQVMGDKVPFYTRVLPRIAVSFQDWRVVVMFREPEDVARSYAARAADPSDVWPSENNGQIAIDHWNQVYTAVREFCSVPEQRERVLLLPYEELLRHRDRLWLLRLYAFLGLPPHADVLRELHDAVLPPRHWGAPSVEGSSAAPDADLLTWCRATMAEAVRRWPVTAAAVTDGQEDGIDRLEERERLLSSLRRLADPEEDDAAVLRSRLDGAMRELARRGDARGGCQR